MMYDEIINHMTVDELRNYVRHGIDLTESVEQLWIAHRELSNSWKQIVINQEYCYDCYTKRNNCLTDLRRLEDELEQKYQEYIPRPVCGRSER